MALPPGASSSTGLGAAAGVEALGEETHPRCSLPLVVWGYVVPVGCGILGLGFLEDRWVKSYGEGKGRGFIRGSWVLLSQMLR